MKKALLYKPETDGIGVNVVTYANEAWFNLRGCTKNPSECGDKRKPDGQKTNIFFCKKGKDNQVCPKD